MAIDPATAAPTQLDRTLTERGLALVNGKTTDMADSVLRVPLHYYRDPKITEIEGGVDSSTHAVGHRAEQPDPAQS